MSYYTKYYFRGFWFLGRMRLGVWLRKITKYWLWREELNETQKEK